MDTRTIIGWNVRWLRVAKGLSQERLALATGIDRSYVGRVERGSENVTVATLEAMAKVLEVPVGRLFDEPSPGSSQPLPLASGRKPRAGAPRPAGDKVRRSARDDAGSTANAMGVAREATSVPGGANAAGSPTDEADAGSAENVAQDIGPRTE